MRSVLIGLTLLGIGYLISLAPRVWEMIGWLIPTLLVPIFIAGVIKYRRAGK